MGTPKKAKKSPPPSPKKGPNDRGFYPIAESLLGRGPGAALNAFTRSTILNMWAGRYKVVDIQRRFATAGFKVYRQAIYAVINSCQSELSDKPRSGRPRTSRTPENIAVVKQVLEESKWKPCSLRQLKAKCAKKKVVLPLRTLRQLKREDLDYWGRRGKKKPERAFWKCNRDKRILIAKERLKWTLAQTRRVIWIDQTQCSRDGVGVFQQQPGEEHASCSVPDNKEEKVYFIVAIGNGFKAFDALPVCRPVKRDASGYAIRPKKGTGRREPSASNKKLNTANEGEHWTFAKMKALCTKWLPHLKKAWKVVVDNAPAHKQLIPWLRSHGVKVADQAPYSPDHNLSENAHSDIKRGPRCERSENNVELLIALKKEFKKYDVKYFEDTYCPKYKARMVATIKNKGFPTKY